MQIIDKTSSPSPSGFSAFFSQRLTSYRNTHEFCTEQNRLKADLKPTTRTNHETSVDLYRLLKVG